MNIQFYDKQYNLLICNINTFNQTKGRSFLNVVDIRASDVFKDIPERPKASDDQDNIATAVLASERTVHQIGM